MALFGSIKSKIVAGGDLGMTALSRITLASAGLSCSSQNSAAVAFEQFRRFKWKR